MARLYGDIQSSRQILDFYARRSQRVLPAYGFTLLASAIALPFLVLPQEYADFSRYAFWALALQPNVGFWLDSEYFRIGYSRPILHLWSIGVEIAFYFSFPAVAYLLRRRQRFLVVLSVGSLVLYIALSLLSPKTAFFMVPARAWQFMAGGYAAQVVWRRRSRDRSLTLACLLIYIVAAGVSGLNSAIGSLGAAALSAWFLSAGPGSGREGLSAGAALRWVGRYSYSIYLTHFPIIAWLAYRPFSGTPVGLSPAQALYAIGLTAVASGVLYHLVESPFRRPENRRRAFAAIVAAAAACLFCALQFDRVSMWRLSPRELKAASATLDRMPERCPTIGRLLRPLDRSCLIAGERAPAALLIGDSHADLLKVVLGEEIKKVGGSLYLLINHRPVTSGQNDKDARYSLSEPPLSPADIIGEALRRKAVLIVVHSNNGHFDPEAIGQLAREAARHDIKVAAILPVPQHPHSIPQYLFGEARAGREPRSTVDQASYLAQQNVNLQVLGAYVRTLQNLQVYRTDPYLCAPACQITSADDLPLYWDNQHLTQTGVERLRPTLARVAKSLF